MRLLFIRLPVVGASVIFTLGLLIAGNAKTIDAPKAHGISQKAMAAFTPAGYKLEKSIPWKADSTEESLRIAAFMDANEEGPAKPVMIRLLGWDGRWRLRDTILPHHAANGSAENYGAPNYFSEMKQIQIDKGAFILIRTLVFGGGSGSLQYFDLYTVKDDKLVLLKSFNHGRFENYYFAYYERSIYDADLVCKRGERHGRSFVYTCYLEVKRYGFDGQSLIETGSEKFREKQGNWFLGDSYRFMNVERALKKGEIFAK